MFEGWLEDGRLGAVGVLGVVEGWSQEPTGIDLLVRLGKLAVGLLEEGKRSLAQTLSAAECG